MVKCFYIQILAAHIKSHYTFSRRIGFLTLIHLLCLILIKYLNPVFPHTLLLLKHYKFHPSACLPLGHLAVFSSKWGGLVARQILQCVIFFYYPNLGQTKLHGPPTHTPRLLIELVRMFTIWVNMSDHMLLLKMSGAIRHFTPTHQCSPVIITAPPSHSAALYKIRNLHSNLMLSPAEASAWKITELQISSLCNDVFLISDSVWDRSCVSDEQWEKIIEL